MQCLHKVEPFCVADWCGTGYAWVCPDCGGALVYEFHIERDHRSREEVLAEKRAAALKTFRFQRTRRANAKLPPSPSKAKKAIARHTKMRARLLRLARERQEIIQQLRAIVRRGERRKAA